MNRNRTPGLHGATPHDATVAWMVDDVAARCRAVLDELANESHSLMRLGGAGMLLRRAADDLVAVVELLESPDPTPPPAGFDGAFGLAFGAVADRTT